MKRIKLQVTFSIIVIGLTSVISLSAQKKEFIEIPEIPFKLYWENEPLAFTQNNGELVIEAGAKTDMFRDPNVTYNTDNAPKLMFTPDDDFILTASIHHAFTEKWDGGAIVLKSDSLNWVKFCFEKDYTLQRRVVSVVTKNSSDDCNSVSVSSDKIFYKMAKANNVITLYYSMDGKVWLLVRHFQFNKTGKLAIGFLAQSPLGKSCKVTFGDITYRHKKINDPYTGE
jgi:regulation of enolase protein 1 (concanavalin A-like superfamily)